MLVLALDTATARITAGLVALDGDGPRTLAARDADGARAHAELLTPAIHDLLAEIDRRPGDLDAVVVGLGPGPFTGLRVGLVTAAAMGDALAIPVHGVATHDAMAAGLAAAEPGTLLVVTDARRREVYWSRYADGARTHGPEVGAPAELGARLTGDLAPVDRVVGDAAASVGPTADPEGMAAPGPTPRGLVAVAAPALSTGTAPAPLRPLYLRRPDAVPPGAPKAVTRR